MAWSVPRARTFGALSQDRSSAEHWASLDMGVLRLRIRLEVSPGQVNNLPSPLREEAMQAVQRALPKEEARINREIHAATQRIEWLKQQHRELGHWEELLG